MADMFTVDDMSAIRSYFKLEADENLITKSRFSELFADLTMTKEELGAIFEALDTDGDELITLDDLLKHYNKPSAASPTAKEAKMNHNWQQHNHSIHVVDYSTTDKYGGEEMLFSESNGTDFPSRNPTNSLSPLGNKPLRRPRTLGARRSRRCITDANRELSSETSMSDGMGEDSELDSLSPIKNSPSDGMVRSGSLTARVGSSLARDSISPSGRQGRLTKSDQSGSEEDFSMSSDNGWADTQNKRESPSRTPVRRQNLVPESGRAETPVAEIGLLSPYSQEQVCELYQNLHSVDKPELVSQFESILLNVINDVRQYQLENERLEKTYRREKDEHDKHLRRLEEEMEQQVQSIEERVRKQEKERLESEKIELRNQLDAEIIMLQQNLKKLQREGENRLDKGQEEHLLNLKKRLEEIGSENRMLKSELTDAQTNLALIRSQMTTVKQQLDEKNYELEIETKTIEDYVNEQDKLRRQLQMLHEANKTLLDTNDNLREMLDSVPNGSPGFKRTASTDFELGALYKSGASAKSNRSLSPNFPRKGSVMSDYVEVHPGNRPLLESGMMPRFLSESCEDDNIAEDLGDHPVLLSPDSGHSTMRDMNDVNDDTELDSVSVQSDMRRSRRHKRLRTGMRVQEEEPDSHDEESDTEVTRPGSLETFRLPNDHKRSPSVGSRGSNRSQKSLNRDESILSQSSKSSRGSSRRQLPAVPIKDFTSPTKVSKEPERMYKIVLAGDAAVGKSSFIVRLCKGKFVPNLSSTLGVDFQTKMLDIDGQPTALQLWDTAGQERFRSVARTYFRRADGVLLLYDVTYERSFLNLRDWVDAIETNSQEGALKKIPIMLVGNKIDARPELEHQGRRVVKHDDGVRLSREIDALFIETSAKDGANIHEAVIELTRLLRTNEDLEVKTVGMQLHEMKDKKSGSCCKRS
ncbi:ras and EF-hand domain-containing protein homolog isoform X1 [Biomphalaria glabrata]|uniref:Ras and EF-hand domain-containing protein homolog isoform X1 n=1 Tax=Biomphalaria glabrata TaxID=6526 RepID=A0A9W3BKK6_BIOGL|nr:ras and EF-hand domain-containing protein homolog isoform X1 [Biomphalaria glabrata]XP_055899961.1 ras and EF-hand domain-containing protein homolog isoform X1 [Biomphalaria glabrata]XP_055899962.1 ras and EF-hand domain-containing protein homolog isoform X1 [Biomphalaria glabrata]XP_055899963.1 ras and EF-hand domain-containing protein homolog isoform X1 [Biomphalaria glabrata]XP_055899964.1 ras and EF-hand domain-containing protein homolog isoform X1 [Biomphalaria glabrata]